MKNRFKKIFISHSYADKKLADRIIDKILVPVFQLNKSNDIFYTSKRESGISSRSNWKESIKSNLKDCSIFIAIITSNFKKSEMCLGEIGAAWVLNKRIYTLILPPIEYETFSVMLSEFQSDKLLNNSDIKSFITTIALDLQSISNIEIQEGIDIEKLVLAFTKSIRSYIRKNPISSDKERLKPDTKDNKQIEIKSTVPISIDIPDKTIKLIKENSKLNWPDDYTMQEYYINEQITALNKLLALSSNTRNDQEILRIIDNAIRNWPDDFSMQLYTAEEEIAAYTKLKQN